MIHVLYSQVNC